MGISHAIFAAGCFWGVQNTFDAAPGVLETTVGYTGGSTSSPSYQQVCKGNTGHAEAVLVSYRDDIITYEQLLDIFFAAHDPTTPERQGPDIGPQYRSAIFYLNNQQRIAALNKIKTLNASGIYSSPIVTEVTAASEFYPAEEYHQKYLCKQGRAQCPSSQVQPLPNEDEWKKRLTPEQYAVLRQKQTERPFSGKHLNTNGNGTFTCAACGNPLFTSENKFDSGSGWPSFDQAMPGHVKMTTDYSHGIIRNEICCARCGSHLGHVFEDGPTHTRNRFCINSAAMEFMPKK